MKVSIIIPVYNVSPYICRCLSSVSKQSFSDIECILVDDCGTDNSIELAKKFIKEQHGNIIYTILYHNKNKGLSAARNTGLKYAKGDYVYFLDSDDAITVNCIEILMNLAIKYPEADYIQGNILDEKGKINKLGWHTTLPEYCNTHDELEKIILSKVVTSAWNKVIKKSFLNKYELYFPEGIIHEDMYWSFFLIKYVRAVAFANIGTYIYFTNENSILTSISNESIIKRYSSRLYASEAFCSDLDKRQIVSKSLRLFVAGNLTSTMIELSNLHSIYHWFIFWKHVYKLYTQHKKLKVWHHLLFIFMMPPFCFLIGIKGWYWRLHRYIINNI